ncbi:MAG TPA: ComEC/Rec2 family competence protein [Drouetiella sp.]
MSSLVLSNARLTVLVAALAAVGSVLDTANASLLIVVSLTVAIFALLLCICRASKQFGLRSLGVIFLLSSLPAAFFFYAHSRHIRPPDSDLSTFRGKFVVYLAFARAGDLRNSNHDITLEPVRLEFPSSKILTGKTRLSLRHAGIPPVGEASCEESDDSQVVIRVRGYVAAPRTDVKPWEFDKAKWLAKDGVFSICYPSKDRAGKPPALSIVTETENTCLLATQSQNVGTETAFLTWYESRMQSARQQIVLTHRRFLPSKLADLFSSMVLGNRAIALPSEITYKFRDVGLSHILAASGFNLTIVIAMTFAICRFVVPWAVPANILCFISMLSFVSLAGPSPSVLRAALMCSIMLAARAAKRRLSVSSTLAGAFLLTVIFDPVCTSDLGLQLSYAATVGIVIGTTALSESLYIGLSKWKKLLADSLAVVLVAQFSVLPIQLFFFWKTGTLFVPANLLITPLVTPVTMIGFASSALALLAPLQAQWQTIILPISYGLPIMHLALVQSPIDLIISICDAVAFIPLAAMMLMVNAFSSVEAAKIALGPPSPAAFVVYYMALIFWLTALRLQRLKNIALCCFIISIGFLVWRPAPPLLSVANIHGQIVLIDDWKRAVILNPSQREDKMVERFVSFHGAHIAADSFSSGRLSTHLEYAVGRDVLVVYRDVHETEKRIRTGFDNLSFSACDASIVLSKAEQTHSRNIVLVVSKSDSMTDLLSSSEFAKSRDPHLVELSGWRNQELVLYSKK